MSPMLACHPHKHTAHPTHATDTSRPPTLARHPPHPRQ